MEISTRVQHHNTPCDEFWIYKSRPVDSARLFLELPLGKLPSLGTSQYLVPGQPIFRAEQAEQSDTVFTCLFARVIIQHLNLLRAGTQRVEDLR